MYKAVGSIPTQQTSKPSGFVSSVGLLALWWSMTLVCVFWDCLTLWGMPPFSKHFAILENKNKVESIKVI